MRAPKWCSSISTHCCTHRRSQSTIQEGVTLPLEATRHRKFGSIPDDTTKPRPTNLGLLRTDNHVRGTDKVKQKARAAVQGRGEELLATILDDNTGEFL